MTAPVAPPLLEVTDLGVHYPRVAGVVRAVDGVSFHVGKGEMVGVIGESGCGKTTLARAILGLVHHPGVIVSGSILFRGTDVRRLGREAARRLRGGSVALSVQDAAGALNPLRPIGVHLREAMEAHGRTRRDAAGRVVPLLRAVELPLPEVRARHRAHQLSGGMRQRVQLAMAMANQPELLIADELTTGLDSSAERQVLELLERRRDEVGMTVVLATHDFGLVARLCSRVLVMHAGRVVEDGPTGRVLHDPDSPHTKHLLRSVRRLNGPSPTNNGHPRHPRRQEAGALLSADSVSKVFRLDRATVVTAVDGVCFDLRRGETLGLIGDSGCGKSTLARLLSCLLHPTSGRVLFEGADIAGFDSRRIQEFRRRVQIVFQDPVSSLDPQMSVSAAIEEPLVNFRMGTSEERRARVSELLERVGLGPELAARYPHELSGGQCQRVAIARAVAAGPSLLVCDEPLSSLDVVNQARILDLLRDLQGELGLSYLFISHDVAVVRQLADRVAIMSQGRIVELGPPEQVLGRPERSALVGQMEQS